MSNWLHRWLNPHCDICRLDGECINCDMLRQLLADERENNKRLLSAILHDQPIASINNDEDIKPINIGNKHIPWRVKREMLEAEDRKKAQLIKEAESNEGIKLQSIEELEHELGVVHANDTETEEVLRSN